MKKTRRLSAMLAASVLMLTALHGLAFAEDAAEAELPAEAPPVSEEAEAPEEPEVLLLGDITGDGAVNMKDAMRVLVIYTNAVIGECTELTPEEFLCGNVDGTHLMTDEVLMNLNPIDVLLILSHSEMEMLEEPATWVDIFALMGKEDSVEEDRGDYDLTYLPEYGDYVLVKHAAEEEAEETE